MRLRAIVLAVPLLIAACSSAPKVEPFGPGTQEVVARARALDRAYLENDQKAIDDLQAPEYQFHFVDHEMTARVNAPRTRAAMGAFFATNLIDVRVYGPFAVVLSHYTWERYEGHLSEVWIRRERKWQVLASSADVIAPR